MAKNDLFKKKLEELQDVLTEKAKVATEKIAELADDAMDKADIIFDEAKETGQKISENIKQMRLDTDRKMLRPIFIDDLEENTFDYPRMINLCEEDEKHKNNPVCANSIGFHSSPNDVELLNIYNENVDKFAVTLEPKSSEGVYYANPFISNTYIEIEEYFKYIQKEKATELLHIARDLGAKYVKIEIFEKSSSSEQMDAKANLKVGKIKADAQVNKQQKDTQSVSVFADEELAGHDNPIRPKLVYFKNDKTILDIIEQRFDENNILKKHTFKIDSSSSSCMKQKEAMKIDGALSEMKCGISESMSIGAERANSSYFSYTIEF